LSFESQLQFLASFKASGDLSSSIRPSARSSRGEKSESTGGKVGRNVTDEVAVAGMLGVDAAVPARVMEVREWLQAAPPAIVASLRSHIDGALDEYLVGDSNCRSADTVAPAEEALPFPNSKPMHNHSLPDFALQQALEELDIVQQQLLSRLHRSDRQRSSGASFSCVSDHVGFVESDGKKEGLEKGGEADNQDAKPLRVDMGPEMNRVVNDGTWSQAQVEKEKNEVEDTAATLIQACFRAEKGRRDVSARKELVQQAEEQARKEAEEQAKKEAEEQAKKEAEEQARQEAEEQARLEAEEQARQEAEEQARKEAEEQARQEAVEQARQEAEEQARKEAEEQARQEAEEQARQEAEEQAKKKAPLAVPPGSEEIHGREEKLEEQEGTVGGAEMGGGKREGGKARSNEDPGPASEPTPLPIQSSRLPERSPRGKPPMHRRFDAETDRIARIMYGKRLSETYSSDEFD
jgi:DNA segregation ATPase FtsK/SpoIIIE-like protein